MCNADTGSDYLSRAVKSAFNPSFNPIKQTKTTLKNSVDVMGQQKAAEEDQRARMSQQRSIDSANQSVINASGNYVPAQQKVEKRRRMSTLLTDETNSTNSLLG